jgi:alanine-synthesizing transaminase
MLKQIKQSKKLIDVCYDIRGPILEKADALEKKGHEILKLNIGNPAPFGFNAPDDIISIVMKNLANAQGYMDSKGLISARQAILQECLSYGIDGVQLKDIYLGNGVSELISLSMQALISDGDEVLIPSPDYPLWTASVTLSGGNPVHYLCDEKSDWHPSITDIESKINSRTRAIVIINPNNPTGAVYDEKVLTDIVELARKYELVIFADEIYGKITFNNARFIPIASLSNDVITVSFSGLSKSYRLAGFRCGWMVLSGAKQRAQSYIEGLDILSNMRLCSNVPAQFAVEPALNKDSYAKELTLPGSRLEKQRDITWNLLNAIPGVSCVKPKGAFYLFPKLDPKIYKIGNDENLVLDILSKEKILLVQGSAFNIEDNQHFRIVFLPSTVQLSDALRRIARILESLKLNKG